MMSAIFQELENRATETFRTNGLDFEKVMIERTVDARYKGQNFELRVPLSPSDLGANTMEAIKTGFDSAHEQFYGYRQVEQPVECVTCRLRASLPVPRPELARQPSASRAGPPAPRAERKVFFESVGGFVDCPVYVRSDFAPGDALKGPAIVEQMDTTTVLPPDFTAHIDVAFNLRLTRGR
jgi:N-methylhydantoinase A